jgi:gamma-glutamylcyclotransferase (GGCT)/AIG2-like uncharacterized protein YtfP
MDGKEAKPLDGRTAKPPPACARTVRLDGPGNRSTPSREEPVDRCEDLCKALNKTWNAYYSFRKRHGGLTKKEIEDGRPSDTQGFNELLLTGLEDSLAQHLCECKSVAALAEFSPQVMNHETLMKRDYDPRNLSEELGKEACDEHRQLLNALKRYSCGQGGEEARKALLRKLRQLLYVIRCNIAHSEKTPRGPDIAKIERDRAVSEIASAVIEDVFDLLLERPSQRLAFYGTLFPGEPNEVILADIQGDWTEGIVRGELTENMGLRSFRWRESEQAVYVRLLISKDLPNHLARIDRFEGKKYTRSLIPVACGLELTVANIYVSA